MEKIVILGGGLTGLSAAYHLEQQGYNDYLLFEQEQKPGGLCRSVIQDNFTFDYSGHLLHLRDPYVQNLIRSLTKTTDFQSIQRRSFIYSHNKHTPYPFQTNLYGLPINVITDCITSYVERPHASRPLNSFYDWVMTYFGAGFGRHFFFPYNEKLWCTPATDMCHTWTGRFVPQTTLIDILHGALGRPQSNIGYNASFLYPTQGGIQYLPQLLADQLRQPVQYGFRAQSIDHKKKVIYFENGNQIAYTQLISTMPLPKLLGMRKKDAADYGKSALPHLRSTSLVNFNLGIRKPNISDKHWIYFPEKKYIFYRLGFWHNFSSTAAPKNHSALYGEYCYLTGKKNEIELNAITQIAIEQVKTLYKLNTNDIATTCILHIPYAYVIYDAWRTKNLPSLLAQLNRENIYSVGRFGAWKYSSMEDAILDGRSIAAQLLQLGNKKYLAAQRPISRHQSRHTKKKHLQQIDSQE